MLSVRSINAGSNLKATAGYYEGYTVGKDPGQQSERQHDEPAGKWCGSLVRARGYEGAQVSAGEIEKALTGFDPKSGAISSNNAGAENHKPGHDLTFSAPKSVSIAWSCAQPELQKAISAAQQRAVEKAVAYAEKSGAFYQRVGHAGEQHVNAEQVSVATFEHASNRAGEPHLHTHAVLCNISENGKRVAFDSYYQHTLGTAYRAEFAQELEKLGFSIEKDGKSFAVVGVPADLQKDLSTRAAQIAKRAAATNTKSDRDKDVHQLATRDSKSASPRAEAFATAREAAKAHEFATEKIIGNELGRISTAEDMLSSAFVEASTLSRAQLERAAFEHAQVAGGGINGALENLQELEKSGEIVLLRDSAGNERYTSREMLEIETGLADYAKRAARAETASKVSEQTLHSVVSSKTLSDEQQNALRHIARNGSNFAIVEGTAGAGKSYMLSAAREAWERDGSQVIGCALAGKAAAGLQESAGIKSETLHSTLARLESGELTLDSKSVVVVDEAGMVGSRLMSRLTQQCEKTGAKLVLVGDTKQLQPIDAGGAMRCMRNSAGGFAVMNEIRRQHNELDKEIVTHLKNERGGAALAGMSARGYLREHADADAARGAMAGRVVGDLREQKTSIALAARRADVDKINSTARTLAREQGLLSSEDKSFVTQRAKDATEVTKQFAVGDRVITLQNDKSLQVKNGQTWTVTDAQDGKLTLKRDGDCREMKVTEKQYKHIDYAYCATVHKSQGVTVDRAHVLHDSQMSDRSLSYVAASRHRESMTYNYTKEQAPALQRDMQRVRDKDTSADYKRDPQDPPAPPAPGGNSEVQQRIETRTHDERTRDAALARSALATRGNMPAHSKIERDVKAGKAQWQSDSRGEQYLTYKNGKTYHRELHGRVRETQLRQAKTLGLTTKKAMIVDRHLIDFKIAGKRIQAIKTGEKVIIGRDTLKQKLAGRDRDELKERMHDKNRGNVAKAWAGAQDKVYKTLNAEGWRGATMQEAVRTKLSAALETHAMRAETRERLEKVAAPAPTPTPKPTRDNSFER